MSPDTPEPGIGDLALLGDGNGAALVDRTGTIVWLCTRRFDDTPTFGRLLDPAAGHWRIAPVAPAHWSRRYLPGTLVLVTEATTATGTVEVHDALALDRAEPHALGRSVPHALVRSVRATAGEVEVRVEVAPGDGRGGGTAGGALRADVPLADGSLEPGADGRVATVRLRAGQRAGFVLAVPPPDTAPSGAAPPDVSADSLLDDTIATWRSWSAAHDRYDGFRAADVRRSSLVLQALTHQPTGAVIAAATTSLPEVVGGEANWDYRFAWLRDAALVLRALWVGACPDEADRYLRWMAEAVARDDEGSVPVLYAVDGGHTLAERELTGLRGYRGSRPVRVGNDAWRQRQLDVPGHVLAAAWLLRDRLVPDDTAVTAVLRRLADLAARRWHEPDSGIWEGREGERHYVSSKVMCWVALDRAVRFGERLADPGTRAHWAAERDRVRASVERDGWNEAAGVFTGAYTSDHLDASALLIPLVGFLPADDPRVEATVVAVERDLARDGLVRRWSGAEDGAFLPCSYWLAECHALAGRAERATAVFEAATAHANDLGLLAEMADPGTGELLGNFPQALSHAGLVSAAWAIDQARAQGAAHPSRDA